MAAVILALLFAACSGGAVPLSPGAGAQPAAHRIGHIKFGMRVPSRKRMQEIHASVARAMERRGKKPAFLPNAVGEIDFNLVSPTGGYYSFTITPSSNGHCSSHGGGYDCEGIVAAAPAGVDTWQIVACVPGSSGCNQGGGAQIISEVQTTITVQPQGESTCGGTACVFTLDPVVAAVILEPGTNGGQSPDVPIHIPFFNGVNPPTWNAGLGYSCTYGSCYEPIINDNGAPEYDYLSTLEFSEDSGTIAVPTVGTESSSPYLPIYLTTTGDELDIAMFCPNQDTNGDVVGGNVNWIGTTNTVPADLPLSASALTSTNDTLANGFYSSAYGNHAPLANSPDTTRSGNGHGTDFNGNVSNHVYGNDGAYINFDGGATDFALYPIECALITWDGTESGAGTYPTFSSSAAFPYVTNAGSGNGKINIVSSSKYYVGMQLGSTTPVINMRHKPNRRPH
ncbi:MAG: hypothetical protein JO199_01755 [Candidatus Eremiobacteraeota bacterium]|nr:hypothetical protein [Candidatus Eremiobacteraeota bacterium]